MKPPITDLDVPPKLRVEGNYWKSKYFEAYKELVNANRGIRRLKRKLEKRQLPTTEDLIRIYTKGL